MARSEKLGEIILDLGYASSSQVSTALERQTHWRRGLESDSSAWRLGRVLCKLGWCTPEGVAKAVAYQAELPYVRLNAFAASDEALDLLPKELAVTHSAIPLGITNSKLAIASSEQPSVFALEELAFATGKDVSVAIASEDEVRSALRDHYGHEEPDDRKGYLVAAAVQLMGLALAESVGPLTLELRRTYAVLSGTWSDAHHSHHLPLPSGLQARALEALDLLEPRKSARVPAHETMVHIRAAGRTMLVTCSALRGRPGEATLTLERIY